MTFPEEVGVDEEVVEQKIETPYEKLVRETLEKIVKIQEINRVRLNLPA